MEPNLVENEYLRYPVGRFTAQPSYTASERDVFLAQIATLPAQMKQAVTQLAELELEKSYRPGGWTKRQVVHHVADSHLNAYIRMRLALTEDNPTVRPYAEDRWAELTDAYTASPEVSLQLLTALHERWVLLLRSLAEEAWHRTFYHPENGTTRLDQALATYAWHGRHHLGHLKL